MNYRIAPSLLAADFAKLGAECEAVLSAGADMLHLDVMDQHYVPNLTFGPLVLAALRRYGINAPIDVHLMVDTVDPLIEAFADAGANAISFHPDAVKHVQRSLRAIKERGCQAGLALNPACSLHEIEHVLDDLDFVLIMSVNPGFGGQQFIPHSIQKIQTLRNLLQTWGAAKILIAVDGGIQVNNIASVAKAGADTFIAGSAIFQAAPYEEPIRAMRLALEKTR